MSAKDFAIVALRLFVLYALYRFIMQIPYFMDILYRSGSDGLSFFTAGVILAILFPPALLLAIWYFADKLADWIVKTDSRSIKTTSVGLSASDWQTILFRCLGVAMVIPQAAHMARIATVYLQSRQLKLPIAGYGAPNVADWVSLSVMLVLAMVLIFGADVFAKWLQRFVNQSQL